MITQKTVLITGGGGFIGTSLAERLIKYNRVILLDVNFEVNSFVLSNIGENNNIKVIKASVLDYPTILSVVKDVDIVVHMAAILGVKKVIKNPKLTLDTNYIGTSNLLKAASQNPKITRFILLSSSEVFGSNAFKVKEESSMSIPSVEGARWCYAISKLAGEQLAFGYHLEMGLPAVVIRPFNIFGPKRIGDYVVLRFIYNALHSKDLIINGDGSQFRSWCYIDDFIEALIKCLEEPSAIGQAFNIGYPSNTLTILHLAKKIIQYTGASSNITFDTPEFSDIDVRIPNIDKAEVLLNFNPAVDIDTGLLRTIEWFRKFMPRIENILKASIPDISR